MNYAILILINIALGVIFYLIISLRLEKSASDFREKKLHNEMNKIIKEFNITAERNISLLENRIKVLQNLLKQHEHIVSVDITVDDENDRINLESNKTEAITTIHKEQGIESNSSGTHAIMPYTGRGNAYMSVFMRIKELLSAIFKLPMKKSVEYTHGSEIFSSLSNEKIFHRSFKTPQSLDDHEYIIEKECDEDVIISEHEKEEEIKVSYMSDEEIDELIHEDMDIYAIISALHEKGLQTNEIARHVGIPEGEIKLVLNLNSTK